MIAYTTTRHQFGEPIAGHQLVQELLADTAVDVDCARLLTWRVADLKTRGEHYSLAASKAKYFASEASVRVANACVQVHGGYGYVDEYPAGKYLRDARVTTLYEGTSQVQKLLIGRALTGHQRVLTTADRSVGSALTYRGSAPRGGALERAVGVTAEFRRRP